MMSRIAVTHTRPRCVRACAILFAIAALVATLPAQQQPNAPTSALSVSGSGRVDASSVAVPTNCMVVPPPAGSAPFFHHRAAARTPVELRIDGPSVKPIILALATGLAPTPFFTPGGVLELDLASGLEIVVDGLVPTNLVSQAAWTGAGGTWSLLLPPGLPATMPLFHLQGFVVDPSLPSGFALTATVSVEVRNDIETSARTFLDALSQLGENPLYLLGAASTSFLTQGFDAAGLGATLTLEPATFGFGGVGPNLTTDPVLPTGAPTVGQSLAISLPFTFTQGSGCGAPTTRGGSEELHDWKVVEDGGVWKIHGDQRDALVTAAMGFTPNPATTSGFDTWLVFTVEDEVAPHGGVASVQVCGPQLASVSGGTALSSATGCQPLMLDDGGGGAAPSEWLLEVQVNASGSSRIPWIENASGPRDSYAFTITWNDGWVSGPYTVDLRGAVDPSVNAAAALAGIPGTSGPSPTAILSNAGTASATLAMTLDVGTLPAGTTNHFTFEVGQSPGPGIFNEWEKEDIVLATPSGLQSITICVPGMMSGVPVSAAVIRYDVHGNGYVVSFTFTP